PSARSTTSAVSSRGARSCSRARASARGGVSVISNESAALAYALASHGRREEALAILGRSPKCLELYAALQRIPALLAVVRGQRAPRCGARDAGRMGRDGARGGDIASGVTSPL